MRKFMHRASQSERAPQERRPIPPESGWTGRRVYSAPRCSRLNSTKTGPSPETLPFPPPPPLSLSVSGNAATNKQNKRNTLQYLTKPYSTATHVSIYPSFPSNCPPLISAAYEIISTHRLLFRLTGGTGTQSGSANASVPSETATAQNPPPVNTCCRRRGLVPSRASTSPSRSRSSSSPCSRSCESSGRRRRRRRRVPLPRQNETDWV